MADMLKFRKGLYADLPATKTAGTIYVTTDEQAMYVDVSASQRVRVGDIIQKNSVRDAEPPYSTEALYYFIEENALLKWGPFGKDGAMAWKQLNSVSDITADLTDVKTRLTTAETAITKLNANSTTEGSVDYKVAQAVSAAKTELQGNIDTEKGRIDTLNTTVGGHTTQISGLTTRLDATDANVTENATNIAGLDTRVGDLETTVGKTAAEGLQKKVGDLETLVGATDADGLRKKVKDNADNITSINGVIGADDTAGLRKKIVDVTTTATDNKTAIAKLNGGSTVEGSVDYKIAAAQTALNTAIEEVDDKVDALANGQVTTNKSDIAGLKTALAEAQQNISDNTTNIQNNANDIATLNGTGDGSVAKAVADAKADLQGEIDTANGKITTNANNIASLTTRMGDAETAIADHDTRLTNLEGDESVEGSVKAQIKAAKDALSAEIDKDINAANAMNYIGAVGAYSALPTSGVHVGDTYVVSTKFDNAGETYHAGDLLVATGDENDDGVITANLAWNHVKTGYIGEHESKLSGADNAIKLTSYLSEDLGTVTFKSATSDEGGVVVSVTNNQVSIDFEWGTF